MNTIDRVRYIVSSFSLAGYKNTDDIEKWLRYLASQSKLPEQLDHIEGLVDQGRFDEAYGAMGF